MRSRPRAHCSQRFIHASYARTAEFEITEEWKDGVLHVEARTGEGPEPPVAIQLAADRLCPHCLSTVLRGVLERHESGGSSQVT